MSPGLHIRLAVLLATHQPVESGTHLTVSHAITPPPGLHPSPRPEASSVYGSEEPGGESTMSHMENGVWALPQLGARTASEASCARGWQALRGSSLWQCPPAGADGRLSMWGQRGLERPLHLLLSFAVNLTCSKK